MTLLNTRSTRSYSASAFCSIVVFSICAVISSCKEAENVLVSSDNVLSYVDPFVGTGGHGHTYPGCSAPFGMMQLSPDTRLEGWDGCSGYHYSDSIIYGFSHTHLSGTGVGDYCDILFMPLSKELAYSNIPGEPNSYPSKFQKENEYAEPGYYSVKLDRENIWVELTSSKRAGVHKYTFPDNNAKLLIDLVHRDQVLDAHITKRDARTVVGSRISSSWAEKQHLYFAARFSHDIKSFEIVNAEGENLQIDSLRGQFIKAGLIFDVDTNVIIAQVAISAVSPDNALKNLDSEVADKSFNEVKEEVQSLWKDQLTRIEVASTDEEVLKVFYTSLYHASLAPNLYSDVDGMYRATDHKVHYASAHEQYTVFSLWDTYRAAHPLYTITNIDETYSFIRSFLNQYEQGGQLPVWELAANYTGCMIGYHSVPVMLDAYRKGIIGESEDVALAAMLAIAEANELGKSEFAEHGYIPAREESESVSKTLEYAYDDWCIAEFARRMGKLDVYDKYTERAQAYKNIFDPQSRFMRARVNGGWFTPFDPHEVNFNYTEANAWQYNFYVPHDVYTLIDMQGGEEGFEVILDSLFTASHETSGRHQADITGLIGQYAHGNEPSHHMAYLYAYINKHSKTQKYCRLIMSELYSSNPDGLSGNEDCGQMSAWYVFSAMGFYPVNPASEIYVIGSPAVDEVSIKHDNGNEFRVIAHNNSTQNIHIKSCSWNGQEYKLPYISHDMIMKGGVLEFVMTSQAQEYFSGEIPSAEITTDKILSLPYLVDSRRAFIGSQDIEIKHADQNAVIEYSFDGLNFSIYETAITIDSSCAIAFRAVKDTDTSKVVHACFALMPSNRTIKLNTDYANQYSAGGNDALIDQLRGTNDFRTGDWQGYQGKDLTAVVDLGKEEFVKEVIVGCLQDWNSWIFMPEEINLSISNDNVDFIKVSNVQNKVDELEEGCIIQDLSMNCGRTARYLKLEVVSKKKNPEWHRAPGDNCWIFLDEIVIVN